VDIFLVRHGEAAASWGQARDPGLSELGWQQALQTATELAPLLPAQVQLISSPLQRARDTAAPLCEILGTSELIIDDAFSEIPSPVPLPQRQDWLREYMRQEWHTQPETLRNWRSSMMGKLRELEAPSVIFTHFLVLNTIVGVLKQRADTLCFWPDNASVTHLRANGDGLELVQLGRELSTVVN
jgi:broad specificity phosphatase PhoE